MAKVRDPIDLDQDGVFSQALTESANDAPREEHIEAAARTLMLDPVAIPLFETVADLIAYVLSVRAAGGDDKAISAFLDRFSPKTTKSEAKVDGSLFGPPSASKSPEERREAENYLQSLRGGKS